MSATFVFWTGASVTVVACLAELVARRRGMPHQLAAQTFAPVMAMSALLCVVTAPGWLARGIWSWNVVFELWRWWRSRPPRTPGGTP